MRIGLLSASGPLYAQCLMSGILKYIGIRLLRNESTSTASEQEGDKERETERGRGEK